MRKQSTYPGTNRCSGILLPPKRLDDGSFDALRVFFFFFLIFTYENDTSSYQTSQTIVRVYWSKIGEPVEFLASFNNSGGREGVTLISRRTLLSVNELRTAASSSASLSAGLILTVTEYVDREHPGCVCWINHHRPERDLSSTNERIS